MLSVRLFAVLREAWVSAASQRVASLLTVVVVAALCVTVLVTAGSAEGSAETVLSSLDASGTRSIVVRAQAGSGLDTRVLDRLQGAADIDWVGAFGFADDVTNAAFEGGARVSLRPYYGTDLGGSGLLSTDAATQLGFAAGLGTAVSESSGRSYDLAKTVDLPGELSFLEPVVLVPTAVSGVGGVRVATGAGSAGVRPSRWR
ncbi:hypothetical protein B7R25_06670 [Subtercola boreus]|uniref:MacB-like periplasmic core domain-containing protein n=1 Tax=Subtercola boreus TaxID=120213 RepID=A0A3E0WB44_9MICO|nr:hypothetical protein B7R24_06600 [Subtercola boreus]RFA21454.1 hypothetical protein B7R23_06545 [Subtercola boreus]RFA27425.1 hypothetical protein B7R25_06670 [Subtercola boreus]